MLFEAFSIGLVIPLIVLIVSGANGLLEIELISRFHNFIYDNQENIFLYGIIIIFLFFSFKYFYLLLLSFVQFNFTSKIMYRIGSEIFQNYLNRPYHFFLNKNSSVSINNLNKELETFIAVFTEPLLLLMSEILIILGVIFFLLFYNPQIVLFVFFILIIPSALFFLLIKKKSNAMGIATQTYNENLQKNLSQALASIKEIKIFYKISQFVESFNFILLNSVLIRRNKLFFQQIPRYCLEMFLILSFCILAILVNKGKPQQDIIALLSVLGISAFRLLPSLSRSITYLQNINFGKQSFNIIFNEINYDISSNIDCKNFKLNKDDKFKNLKIKNLSFQYQNGKKILDNINIDFNSGEKIGFIGKSGSGKSTLINIITALLSPTIGEVLYNNINIFESKLQWQLKIGYASQSYNLLDDTIAKNIALENLNNKIDFKLLKEVTDLCVLQNLIDKLDNKFDTNIGELGSKISGGQKQRIVIARALYAKPEILILDEATNALDKETENLFFNNLFMQKPNLTVLIVSHKLNTLNQCDKIFEIKDGKIHQLN